MTTTPRDELVERIKTARRKGLTAAKTAAEVRAWIRERVPGAAGRAVDDDFRYAFAIGWNQALALVRERLGL